MDHNTSQAAIGKPVLSFSKIKAAMLSPMKSEPFVSVCMFGVPGWLGQSVIEAFFQDLPQLVRLRHKKSNWPPGKHDFILDFEPGTDAFKALNVDAIKPIITINHHELGIRLMNDQHYVKDYKTVSKLKYQAPPVSAPQGTVARKYIKLDDLGIGSGECYICRSELDGPFLTPCFVCKSAECYECMQIHFLEAMKDFERFPAKCCDVAFHPDIARGIMTDEEHARYKTRFEEYLAKKPIYCPMPTCSVFIPDRKIRQVKDDSFACYACQTLLCASCKQQAHSGQPCGMSSQEMEAAEVIKKFGYKQCPKCGIAVGKMYGCSHVRCNCGAHWCWECRRKIELCNISPCVGANGDDYYDEQSPGPDSESDLSDIDSVAGADSGAVSVHAEGRQSDQEEHHSGRVTVSTAEFVAMPDREMSDFAALDSNIEPDSHPEPDLDPIQALQSELNKTMQADPTTTTRVDDPFKDIDVNTLFNGPNAHPDRFYTVEELAARESMQESSGDVAMEEAPPDPQMSILTVDVSQPTANSASMTNDIDNLPDSPATAILIESKPEPEFVNLDDPAATAWQDEGYYFGEDPSDEDPLDIWGCVHSFTSLTCNKIPRYWMTASVPDWWERKADERAIECMMCWRETKLAPTQDDVEITDSSEDKRRMTKDWRFARQCLKCKIIVCRKCKNELLKDEH